MFRVLAALVNMWCLGCQGFDPLIANLTVQPGSVMVRVSEGGSLASVAAPTNRDEADSVRAPGSAETPHAGADCGCQGCHAPAPAALAAAPAPPSSPDDPPSDFSAPLSIERAPLVPPPQPIA
ncbi:MAG: hypothetical protein ACREOG_09585 [Gemmatimonadaceae bacterium]